MSVAESDSEKLQHHPPLRERVRDRLERLIVNGVYQPGEHLVETDLAKRLGVSRGPIREALYLLQVQGWVDLRPRQGAFVHQPSYEEVDQFFHVRALLEGETTSLAAGNISEAEVAALREQISAARQAIAKQDEGKLIEANAAFHGSIHRIAGNPVLLELVSLLDKRLRWYFSPVSLERADSAWDEHELLLDAIEKGNRDRAVSLTRIHNTLTREAYVRHRKLTDQKDDQEDLARAGIS